jgi:hypothetical protein
MKKLVTAFALCAAMSAMAVDSQNVVGYRTETYIGYRAQTVQFQKPGGGTTYITDIMDLSKIASYSDELQIYDTSLGFVTYLWDGTQWIDSVTDDPIQVQVIPGNSFLVLATELTFMGEVPSLTTYDHPVNPGLYTFVGNALPVNPTLASFDWSAIEAYADELQIYDASLGFVTYLWDGTQWIDSVTDVPLPISTPMNDGFLLLTNLSTITQTL